MDTLNLTISQAQAVYRAMTELNNIGATLDATCAQQGAHGYREVRVTEHASGAITVTAIDFAYPDERYADQFAFAAAYGL